MDSIKLQPLETALENSNDSNPLKAPPSLHRHISMRYGVEFQSKVSLYARSYSASQTQINFETLAKEDLFSKIHKFLQQIMNSRSTQDSLIQTFNILQKKMKLSIRLSTNSINLSTSDKQSINNNSKVSKLPQYKPVQMCRSNSPQKENLMDNSFTNLRCSNNSSLMSKMNRISIADAINIKQLIKGHKPIQIIQSGQSIESQEILQLGSKQDLISNNSQQLVTRQEKKQLKNLKLDRNKKISIDISDDISNSGGSIFSEQDIITLEQLQLPELHFDRNLIITYFDTSSPFLINLAICLFSKSLARASLTLQSSNIGWLLGISTIVAYKVYYDQPIDGLIDFFSEAMKMPIDDLIKLERWFLYSLNYEVVVSTQQYQKMMVHLLTHESAVSK